MNPKLGDFRFWFWAGPALGEDMTSGGRDSLPSGRPFGQGRATSSWPTKHGHSHTKLVSSLDLIQVSNEGASPRLHTSALPHTQTHTHPDTHDTWCHTCTHTHAATHTLPSTPHRHTYSYACTQVHILTLIYKYTLTRGQLEKKNYYSSERNRLPSPLSASRAWAEMR